MLKFETFMQSLYGSSKSAADQANDFITKRKVVVHGFSTAMADNRLSLTIMYDDGYTGGAKYVSNVSFSEAKENSYVL